MARKGKDLELLVESLEKALGGNKGFKITSPDKLPDKTDKNGGTREVDVLARGFIGTCPVTIIFECRDRDGNEDKTWIEQIATKRDDVGANVAVAVSSSGFSEGAKDKAEYHNVQLRTIDEGGFEDFSTWFGSPFMKVSYSHWELFSIGLLFNTVEEIEQFKKYCEANKETYTNVKLKNIKNGGIWTLKQIFDVQQLPDAYDKIAPDKPPIVVDVLVHLDGWLQVDGTTEVIKPACVFYQAKANITTSMVPFKFQQYKGNDSSLADIATAEIRHPTTGLSLLFSSIRDSKSSEVTLTARWKEDTKKSPDKSV